MVRLVFSLLVFGESVVLCSGGFLGGIREGFGSLLLFVVAAVFSMLVDGIDVALPPPGIRDPV